jgi:hypothetical protein
MGTRKKTRLKQARSIPRETRDIATHSPGDRVDTIRVAVDSGEYEIHPDLVAEAMVVQLSRLAGEPEE